MLYDKNLDVVKRLNFLDMSHREGRTFKKFGDISLSGYIYVMKDSYVAFETKGIYNTRPSIENLMSMIEGATKALPLNRDNFI